MKIDPTDLPDDGDPRPAKRWKRSGREQFIIAAVDYLDGLGDLGAQVGSSLEKSVARASDPGPAELGIRLIAKRLGKTASAPLFHFPDRLTLLAAVAAEGFRRQVDFIRPDGKASFKASASHRQTLIRMLLSYIDWAGAHPALWGVMYTPALAPGVDAIMMGTEAYWDDGSTSGARTEEGIVSITEPAGRRRLAFQELHDAKADALSVFWNAVDLARRNGELTQDATSVDIVHAAVSMADGLAWQLINERQQTPAFMQRHAERSIQLLLKGIG